MERYVISVDQSTSATKVFLLDRNGEIAKRFSKNHAQYTPQAGYVEHDAGEIYQNVLEGISAICEGLEIPQIAALAIANQRETTVLWDRDTGEPLHRAIVWQDVRAEGLCREMQPHAKAIHERTGIPLSPYYSAAKAAAVLRENPALLGPSLCVGTVDAYLIHRLTSGQTFATDQSNASRTQLMNLRTLAWDTDVCAWFGIPVTALPEIRFADADFGKTTASGVPAGLPITGVLGDSHAALFGQGCFTAGMAKATYGTGSSVMMNIGETPVLSRNGLSSSVGFGFRGKVSYVLEGNVTSSGDTLCWLRDELGMIQDIGEVEPIAATVPDTMGTYLVPAFSGLGAPFFDGAARALLCGMSRGTTRAHILRAALESIAYQDMDVVDAMARDTGTSLSELRVDGGPTRNALLMQLQADMLDCPVQCAAASELSALGAGYLAGLTAGLYPDFEGIPARAQCGARYTPRMDAAERTTIKQAWGQAVRRARSEREAK